MRQKRGMTAVIRPIRVDDLDFRFGGIALFTLEIALDKLDVGKRHGKSVFGVILYKLVLCHIDKMRYFGNVHRVHFFTL